MYMWAHMTRFVLLKNSPRVGPHLLAFDERWARVVAQWRFLFRDQHGYTVSAFFNFPHKNTEKSNMWAV
jgi:hypothetical protein